MVANKKPNADFIVRMVGQGIRPWAVPLRTLTNILDAVQRLVEQQDRTLEDDVSYDGETHVESGYRTLHLLSVKSKSAAYAVSVPDGAAAIALLSEIGESIDSPDKANWTSPTLSSIEALSRSAKSMGCEIEFREADSSRTYGRVIARIAPSTYEAIAGSAFIRGRTSLYAKIERVGGATAMHCGLRLPDAPRKMVICRVVSDDLVRELGRYMYEHLIVSGDATWVKHDWRLKTLVIDSFDPPKKGSIRETLLRAHDAGGHAWDSVDDPDAAIAEMRRS